MLYCALCANDWVENNYPVGHYARTREKDAIEVKHRRKTVSKKQEKETEIYL